MSTVSYPVVTQQQLKPSAAVPGLVLVNYPAGQSSTVMRCEPTGNISTSPAGSDGPYEQAIVLSNGNLAFKPSGDAGQSYVVLGATLSPL